MTAKRSLISAVRASASLFTALSVAGLTFAAPVQAAETTPNKLAAAKTIQLKQTFLTTERSETRDTLAPMYTLSIEITRPSKVKVILTPADTKIKPSYYLADGGKIEYEYNGPTNSYRTLEGTKEGHRSAQLRLMAGIDLILNPDAPESFDPMAKRTARQDTINGRPMRVRVETRPALTGLRDGPAIPTTEVWFDAKTGFPVRRSTTLTYTQSKKAVTIVAQDFTGWVLNKPLPKERFAFNPPAGAKKFVVPKLLAAGVPAPDFKAMTPDGKTVRLSDFKGKTVVLDFWSTWCGPCRQSLPHLEKVYQKIKEKDVVVLAVCVWDKKNSFDKWVTENVGTNYNFPVAFDPTADDTAKSFATVGYHVTGVPTQYVVNKDGKVAAAIVGYNDGDHRLEDVLKGLGVEVALDAVAPQAAAKAK